MRAELFLGAMLVAAAFAGGCYTQLAPPRYTATAVDDAALPPVLHGIWHWVRLVDAEGAITVVAEPDRYVLALGGVDHLSVRADCNRGRAQFVTLKDDSLTVGPLNLTKIYCGPQSLERRFRELLARPAAFEAQRDSLVLHPEQGGTMTFRRSS